MTSKHLVLAVNMLNKANMSKHWCGYRLLLVLTSIAASLIAISEELQHHRQQAEEE